MMRAFTLFFTILLALSCVLAQGDSAPHDTLYDTPKPIGPVVFLETFNGDHWTSTWKPSTDPKYTGDWKVEESDYVRVSGDRGLIVSNAAKHHAIGALFDKPLDNTGKDLVVQYEVQLQHGLDCGGAYVKLLTASPNLDIAAVNNDYTYTIMFGPDKCGTEDKVHFIVRHENPLNHIIEEKHLTPRPKIKQDKLTHLYTLFVRKDNTFEISIDQEVVKAGDLLQDMQPPINPPKEIDDPTDLKPSDWVDEEYIPDPDATKPEDWDENEPAKIPDPTAQKPEDWVDDAPEFIPDPTASKPVDWDDEEDGEWTAPTIDNPVCIEHGCGEWKAPLIKNPKHKGKWTRPMINNPAFKGVWAPRKISNPHFYEDLHPSNFPKMAGIAFELWTMSAGILFDNIIITHDKSVADDFADKTWKVKYAAEKLKWDSENPAEPGEGIMDTIRFYADLAYQTALENPFVVGVALVAGLVPILVCSFISVPRKPHSPVRTAPVVEPKAEAEPEAKAKPAPSQASTTPKEPKSKKVEKVEIEEIQEEEEEPAKKSPQVRKRRVPRD